MNLSFYMLSGPADGWTNWTSYSCKWWTLGCGTEWCKLSYSCILFILCIFDASFILIWQ